MAAGVELTVEQASLKALGIRLAAEDGGKLLRLELTRNLRTAVGPAVEEIKGSALQIKRESSVAVKSLSKYKGPESDVSIGAAIARGIGTQVRMTGRAVGVSVRARKAGMPRQFVNAPKRFNATKFRHKVYGRDRWVDQIGMPGYFDRPLRAGRTAYRVACVAAMEEMANRLARRA